MSYESAELQRVEDKLAIALNQRDAFRNAANQAERQRDRLAEAARAVIAAGRPHPSQWNTNDQAEVACPCPQCTAWDALAEVLKQP